MRVSLAALALLSSLTTACSGSGHFTSPDPLGEGIRGKVWGKPYFLDPNPGAVSVEAATSLAVRSFDLAVTENQAFLAATFSYPILAGTQSFLGFVRGFTAADGWAGTSFQQVAGTGGVTEVGHLALGASPGGTLFGAFFEQGATHALDLVYRSGSWRAVAGPAVAPPSVPPLAASDNLGLGAAGSVAFDSIGRAYLGYVDNAGLTEFVQWSLATSSSGAIGAPAAATNQRIKTMFDGGRLVCWLFETGIHSTRELDTACYDTYSGDAPTTVSAVSDSASGATVGFDVASDGAGGMMAVFFQATATGTYSVLARSATAGTWSATLADIGATMPAHYEAMGKVNATTPVLAGAVPGIAYLGSGKYLVVWAGVNTVFNKAQLFYSTYDPTALWSAAQALGDAFPFTTRPAFDALTVFSNGNGNAGLAVNTIVTEGDSPLTDIRKTYVARFQRDSGWIAPVLVGNGCGSALSIPLAGCTHQPAGAILADGTSVVLYPDKDTSGRFRLAGVDFR